MNPAYYFVKYVGFILSNELDGSDVREYDASEILAVRNDKVICEMPRYESIRKVRGVGAGGLSLIDARNGREQILVDAKIQYSFISVNLQQSPTRNMWTADR